MKISRDKNYALIVSTETTFSNFIEAFNKQKLGEVSEHKIIQLSENLNTTVKDLSIFLEIANTQRINGISFVIVCKGIDIDDIPDEINVVPTINEAEDVLEMEAIERDLGF